jgi:ABC-2 type transport system permease protein
MELRKPTHLRAQSAVLRIAATEFRSVWRDGRFLALLAITVLLLLMSLGAASATYKDFAGQRDAATSETYRQFVSQPAKNPHSAAHYGMFDFHRFSRAASPACQLGKLALN